MVFHVFSLGFFCFRQAIFATIIVADFQGCYRVSCCLGTAANDDTGFTEAFRFHTPLTSETGDSRSFALARGTCDPSDNVCALKHSEFNFVDEFLVGKLCLTQVMIVGRVPWTTNTTPGGFADGGFKKGRLKAALVVVVEAAVTFRFRPNWPN